MPLSVEEFAGQLAEASLQEANASDQMAKGLQEVEDGAMGTACDCFRASATNRRAQADALDGLAKEIENE